MAKAFCRVIDTINERIGRNIGWLFIPLMLIIVMEVALRYLFNAPQIWSYDVSVQLLGAIAVLGGGYALLHKGHVAIDILVSRLPPRKRLLVDTIVGLFIIGSVGLLLWRATLYGWTSFLIREEYTSAWGPPIFPFKILMVVGISVLLLQGISEFVRNLTGVVRGRS